MHLTETNRSAIKLVFVTTRVNVSGQSESAFYTKCKEVEKSTAPAHSWLGTGYKLPTESTDPTNMVLASVLRPGRQKRTPNRVTAGVAVWIQ
jgi:hypothetical protein